MNKKFKNYGSFKTILAIVMVLALASCTSPVVDEENAEVSTYYTLENTSGKDIIIIFYSCTSSLSPKDVIFLADGETSKKIDTTFGGKVFNIMENSCLGEDKFNSSSTSEEMLNYFTYCLGSYDRDDWYSIKTGDNIEIATITSTVLVSIDNKEPFYAYDILPVDDGNVLEHKHYCLKEAD